MASGKSGQFELSGTNGITVKVFWSEDYTIETNRSVVSIDRLQVKSSSYSSVAYYLKGSITVDGAKVIEFDSVLGTHNADIGSLNTYVDVKAAGSYKNPPWKSGNIDHDSDGSKYVAIVLNLSGWTKNGSKGSGWKVSGSKTEVLTTIARASQPSCITYPNHTQNVGNFGDTISIHMNRKSSAFKHTVRYDFGYVPGICIDADTGKEATSVENGFRWKIPESFMDKLPTATSGTGVIYVDTYSGSTLVGTKYCIFTAAVPASVKPSCTIQVLDATDIQKTYGSLVKGLSKLYVKTNFYASHSSPVAKYNVTANGVKYTASEITTDFLTAAGTTTITATVTDKRGRTSETASASFPVLDYAIPKITALSVHRCDQNGTTNDRGDYVKVSFSASVTPLNNKNTATYTVKYKKASVASWTTLTTDANGKKPGDLTNNYSVTNSEYIFAADGNSAYDVEISVKDNHNTISRGTSASTAFTLYNCHPDGTGWTFGGVSDKSNTLQNNLYFVQRENQYCFASDGAYNTQGFVRIAEIAIKSAYIDAPIVFELLQRGAKARMVVNVLFYSVGEKNPPLQSVWYEGSNFDAYLSETSQGVWGLYVKKSSALDDITLSRWYTAEYMHDCISVTFPGDLVDTVPQGLRGFYKATPAVLQSIIDCLLPVGMIIQLYSHADPNTMYPGTTWVRLENTFLWGCDANGGIGTTGGEKTHALTVNELPVHSHGSVYSQNATGTKSQAWYSTSGDKLAYGVVETGGGAAHNNMPPYTQVSIWRRTA